MSSEDGDDVKLQRPVYLNIHSGGHYGYSNFEVNECFGSFELLSRDSIRFSSALFLFDKKITLLMLPWCCEGMMSVDEV